MNVDAASAIDVAGNGLSIPNMVKKMNIQKVSDT